MFDVSAAGSFIDVSTSGGLSARISEFYDEGTPFETNEIEVTGNAMTLNGQLITWLKPVAYVVTITVIPGSDDDVTLHRMLDDAHIRPGKRIDVSNLDTTMSIYTPSIYKSGAQGASSVTSYYRGRILGGPTGPSTNAEGKLAGRTYTFVFEDSSVGTTGIDVG